MKITSLFLAAVLLFTFSAQAGKTNQSTDTIRTYRLEEIVISSKGKETQKLSGMASAFTMISPLTLQNNQINSLKEISQLVPNLFIPDYGSKLTSAVYVRGIGARSTGQSIGYYVDNVPYLDKSAFDAEWIDIDHVEILRGPQGTLYGRNAMGGVVNVRTSSPLYKQGTKVLLGGGNYGLFKAKASHSMLLAKNLGISASAYYDRNDGYFVNTFKHQRADAQENTGGRIRLDWKISPRFSASLTSSFDFNNQDAFPYRKSDSTGLSSISYNDPSSYIRRMTNSGLVLEYKHEKFLLTATTGHQFLNDCMRMDQDYTSDAIFTLTQKQRQQSVSQEIAIKSIQAKNYQWSFGTFGFYQDLKTNAPVTFRPDGVSSILQAMFDRIHQNNPAAPIITIQDQELPIPGVFKTPNAGIALFHQSTYNNLFVKGLSVTAGLRLDYEKNWLDYNTSMIMNTSVKMGTRPAIPMALADTLSGNLNKSTSVILPKFSIKYDMTAKHSIYASVTKGHKAGGYNIQMFSDLIQEALQNKFNPSGTATPVDKAVSYQPEEAWNYEIGTRCEIIPDHLNLDATFFYMNIRDLQLTKFVDSGNGRIIANAGKANSLGAEVSMNAKINPELSLDLNYGYTRAKLDKYSINDGHSDIDCSGNRVPYTPEHTLALGAYYTKNMQLNWLDQISLSATYQAAGRIYWNETNTAYQNFYGTFNGKLSLRKAQYRIDLWGQNLSNSKYNAFYFESLGNSFVQRGKPCRFGADLIIQF